MQKQVVYFGVFQIIYRFFALFFAVDQISLFEISQLVTDGALVEPDEVRHVVDAVVTDGEQSQDPHTRSVGKGTEEVGEFVHGLLRREIGRRGVHIIHRFLFSVP